jgi:transposase-like protein
VGGKPRHVPACGKVPAHNKVSEKVPVFTMLERGGKKRSFVVKNVTGKNLTNLIKQHVSGTAEVHTDESRLYNKLRFPVAAHKKVNHEQKEYARREGDGSLVSTNSVESSFSLLKRGIVGTFHHVSANHLHRYVAEFDFRWNTRHDSDTERTQDALRKAKGKRLTYEPTRYRRKKGEAQD